MEATSQAYEIAYKANVIFCKTSRNQQRAKKNEIEHEAIKRAK